MPGDSEVRIGIAPSDLSWYLRFVVDWNDDDTAIEGEFDITVPQDLAREFRSEVMDGFLFRVAEQAAEEYYRQIRC